MSAIEPNVIVLVQFSLAWMAFCFGAFVIAGMLPLETASAEIRKPSAVFLLSVNALLLIGLLALTILIGYRELRWTSIVIAGGLIFLLAPFLVQDLPERVKNGQAGLLIVLVITLMGFAAIWFGGISQAFATVNK